MNSRFIVITYKNISTTAQTTLNVLLWSVALTLTAGRLARRLVDWVLAETRAMREFIHAWLVEVLVFIVLNTTGTIPVAVQAVAAPPKPPGTKKPPTAPGRPHSRGSRKPVLVDA